MLLVERTDNETAAQIKTVLVERRRPVTVRRQESEQKPSSPFRFLRNPVGGCTRQCEERFRKPVVDRGRVREAPAVDGEVRGLPG